MPTHSVRAAFASDQSGLTTVDRTFAVNSGDYVLFWTGATGGASNTQSPTVTVQSGPLAIALVKEFAPGVNNRVMFSLYAGRASADGSVTIRTVYAGSTPSSSWTMVTVATNVDVTTPYYGDVTFVQAAAGSNISFDTSLNPVAEDLLVGLLTSKNSTSPITPGAGFTTRNSFGTGPTPTCAVLLEEKTGGTSPTVSASGLNASQVNAGLGIILKDAGGAPPAGPEIYLWDGTSLASSPKVTPYYWDGATLQPLDVYGVT